MGIGVIIGTIAWRGGNSDFDMRGVLAGDAALPLATATLIVAQLISSRGARGAIEGPDDALPMRPGHRITAVLLASMAAPGLALLMMASLWASLLGPDLARTIDGVGWRADAFDLAQPLVLVLGMAWLGVGLGRLNRWVPAAVLLALTLTWSPLVWVNPLIVIDPAVADPHRDTAAAINWQVAFLSGLAVTGAALAFLRAGVRPARLALPVAVLLTAAAGVARF